MDVRSIAILISIVASLLLGITLIYFPSIRNRWYAKKWISNIRYLTANGWKIVNTSNTNDVRDWHFKASDEHDLRLLNEAVERQKRLDEIRKYNLPDTELKGLNPEPGRWQ